MFARCLFSFRSCSLNAWAAKGVCSYGEFQSMHRTDEILERIYERDHDIGAFVIAAALENYSGFFNELDPSPFRKRDIDHDLRVFLED